MGFFKKVFGDAADDLKKSIEDSKNEMRKSLEDMKRSAMADFGIGSTSSRKADDDDEDEPRIKIGNLENGVLTISEGFSELDDESLEEYKRLRKIVFPASLKKLESDVISDQEKLEAVDFSKVTQLKEIPDDFISGETRIKEFVIPQGVTKVGDGFLGECGAGTKVFVPASVKSLGYINGNSNNDQYVYLFASNLDLSDVEEDIKTLYVLPKYYGYYAKQLKECDSEARLREMPEEMMNIYNSLPEEKETKKAVAKLEKVEKTEQVKPLSLTPPDKMEFEMFDESENETLFEHGFRFVQVPESGDVIYDIVNLEDSDLYLRKTNDNRYYRFYMYSPGELCVDKDFRAYSKVEHTEFDLARYFKDYENDETEGDSEYDVDKKLFYGVEKNTKAPSQEYLPLDWEFVQFDEDENEYLGKHGFTYPRDTDVIYDIVGHDDYELFLVKTNNGRYFRFDPFGTGRLQIDADLNAYGIVEVTPFDFERFCKDYENDEVEDDLDEYEIEDKKAFYGCEQKVVIAEPTPEPEPIPEPKLEPQIATTSKVLTTNEKRYEIKDFKRKKVEDLRKARDAKDKNKTTENVNRWKQIIADIQVVDNALKGGFRTLDELKEAAKQNESLIAEINEFMGISEPLSDPKPEPVIVSEPENSVYKGLFSERLEALISSGLQDGVLTDQEKAVLKKRAEKDGEDWDEVEMIINSRLAEIQKTKGIQIQEPHDVQVNRKKPMELNDIKRALLFLSYKSCEESDYAFLFLIDNNKLYATNENYNTPEIPSCDYFEELDDYECWIENISDEYQSFKQLSISLVDDFTDARLEEFEGDTSALAIDSKYTVTVFVGDEKVYEETMTCR